MTDRTRAALPDLLPLLLSLPDDQHVDVADDGVGLRLDFQCYTQSRARAVRALFPGAIWKKKFSAGVMNWWEYDCEYKGIGVHIYACQEAPPTCRMEKRIVEVEEQVPVEFETRMVEREIIEWKCDGEEAEA